MKGNLWRRRGAQTSSGIERVLGASRTRPVLAIEVVASSQEQRRCDAGRDGSSQRAAEASGETDHGVTPIRSPWKGGYSQPYSRSTHGGRVGPLPGPSSRELLCILHWTHWNEVGPKWYSD